MRSNVKHTKTLLAAVLLVLVGCQAVTPEQAVNINEVHDGIVRLMPYAAEGIRADIAAQTMIANDESASHEARSAAEARVVELTGRLLETSLLPEVSAPIRDWAIARVGTDTYLKAKADRDSAVAGGH